MCAYIRIQLKVQKNISLRRCVKHAVNFYSIQIFSTNSTQAIIGSHGTDTHTIHLLPNQIELNFP